jgi:hypothetical protein
MHLGQSSKVIISALALLAASLFSSPAFAQGPLPEAPMPSSGVVEPVIVRPRAEGQHKFWDPENRALFVAVAATSVADFAVTRANLQSGGQELNPVVRLFGKSTAGLAANFAGEAACVVSASYFFHKTGHHKLERIISMVNIGASSGAITYGLAHRGVK